MVTEPNRASKNRSVNMVKVDLNNSPNFFSSWIRVRVKVWVGSFQLG